MRTNVQDFLLLLSHGMLIPQQFFLLLVPSTGDNNIEARYMVQVSAVGIAVTTDEAVLVGIIRMV